MARSQADEGSDDVPLDFARARIELSPNRVAQLTLHFILCHVTITAVNLDRVLSAFHPGIGKVELGHGGFEVDRFSASGEPPKVIEHVTCALHPELHIDDL